jgi:hypothetical protein
VSSVKSLPAMVRMQAGVVAFLVHLSVHSCVFVVSRLRKFSLNLVEGIK